jgi:hypothetical protein
MAGGDRQNKTERLAAALRRNLKRRKQQARMRKRAPMDEAPGAGSAQAGNAADTPSPSDGPKANSQR